jgi:hypothetical protein
MNSFCRAFSLGKGTNTNGQLFETSIFIIPLNLSSLLNPYIKDIQKSR